jgi:hypothetical protein
MDDTNNKMALAEVMCAGVHVQVALLLNGGWRYVFHLGKEKVYIETT